jgi:hypothetical protein
MKRIVTVGVLLVASMPLSLCAADSTRLETEFRHRVFEAKPALIDKLVPDEERKPLPTKPREDGGTDSWLMAPVRKGTLGKLVKGIHDKPGVLVDRKRVIPESPGVADTWAYSRADPDVLGAGTGGGCLGVQEKDGRLKLTIRYDVTHTINATKPVCSQFTYEGPLPETGAVLFLQPFARQDGTSRVLVVAFEIRVFEIRERRK